MADRYERWIAANVVDPHGQCVNATRDMAEAFPELRRVRGHAHCPIENRAIPHWWLVAPDGAVVDPTAGQFASPAMVEYVEYLGPEPTGHCLNCGALLFGESGYSLFCNEACWNESKAYYEAGGCVFVNGDRVL